MKKLTLALAVSLAMPALAMAQAPEAAKPAEKATEAKPADKPAETKPAPKLKSHKLEAEVVSADVEKKTLTFKVEGAEKTAPVGPLAAYRLKKVKAGDKVTLTCKDDEKGEHQEIAIIRPVTPPAAPADAKPATTEKKPEASKP